jgi:hypothetical protein
VDRYASILTSTCVKDIGTPEEVAPIQALSGPVYCTQSVRTSSGQD